MGFGEGMMALVAAPLAFIQQRGQNAEQQMKTLGEHLPRGVLFPIPWHMGHLPSGLAFCRNWLRLTGYRRTAELLLHHCPGLGLVLSLQFVHHRPPLGQL